MPGRSLAELEVARDLLPFRARGEEGGPSCLRGGAGEDASRARPARDARRTCRRAYRLPGPRDSLVASGGGLMRRRELIKGAAMVASLPVTRLAAREAARIRPRRRRATAGAGSRPGVASYTLRKLPLDAAIVAVKRVGLLVRLHQGLPPAARQHDRAAQGGGREVQGRGHHAPQLRQRQDEERRRRHPARLRVRARHRRAHHRLQPGARLP